MVSVNFSDYIVDCATRGNLQVFVKEVIKSIRANERWDDRILNNALELISGSSKPIHSVAISSTKVMEYLHKCAYKGEESNNCKILSVNNFKCNVRVSYNSVRDGELDCETDIPLFDVI